MNWVETVLKYIKPVRLQSSENGFLQHFSSLPQLLLSMKSFFVSSECACHSSAGGVWRAYLAFLWLSHFQGIPIGPRFNPWSVDLSTVGRSFFLPEDPDGVESGWRAFMRPNCLALIIVTPWVGVLQASQPKKKKKTSEWDEVFIQNEIVCSLKTKIICAFSLSRKSNCLKSKLVLKFYQRMDVMDLIKVLNFSHICFL